jgi:hypothetical protein
MEKWKSFVLQWEFDFFFWRSENKGMMVTKQNHYNFIQQYWCGTLKPFD